MAQAGQQRGNPLDPNPFSVAASGSASSGEGSASGSIGLNVTGANVVVPAVDLDKSPGMPQAPQAMNIDGEFNNADYYVEFGATCAEQAGMYVSRLADLASSLRPPTVNPVFPVINAPPAPITTPAPTVAPSNYADPNRPAAFTDGLDISTAFPAFASGPPQLTFPNAPAIPQSQLPTSPSVDLNFTYPKVDVTLPSVPQLLGISVEAFNGVDFPTLTATAPVLTAVAPSPVAFVPNAPYTDALLEALKANLKGRIDIGRTGKNTGLPAAVEAGIWNRGREREYRQQANDLAALDKMEAMGYSFPPGTFVDARIKLLTETNYVIAGQSRDVATEQAKLEQANLKDAYEQTLNLEGKLIDYANQAEERRFQVAKYMTDAGVQIYNAQVQAFAQIVAVYRAQIDVFTAQINGARAQVEIYQAKIAAEKLKVDANTALIQQYKVQVDAALASIEVFKGEISVIQTQAQVEQLKVSVFGEQVRAYAAGQQAYATTVEGYKATIEAENTKQQVYATAANVYGTLVTATAKQIDAKIAGYQARISAKNLEVETYKAEVQSQAEKVRAIAAQNQSVAAIYQATVQGQASYNEVVVKGYEASMSIAEKVAEVATTAAKANGDLALAAASIATDAAKVGAQVEAQMAASAIGAVTFATHKSRQDSMGWSQSIGFSSSRSNSFSGQVSAGSNTNTSTSTSTSLSTQVSGGTSNSHSINVAEAQ